MTARAVLVDTAVLAYAVGGQHRLRDSCQRVVVAAGAGELELHASVEMVQEFLFHRLRMTDRVTAVAQARSAAALCTVHEFTAAILDRAIALVAESDYIGGRDAVHAATALVHGIDVIVSPDRAFDNIVGVRRMTPAGVLAERGDTA